MTSLLPQSGSEFSDPEYWKKFFASRKAPFEWYGDYEQLGPILEKYTKPADHILQLGCGNSMLASQMYDNGFRQIVSIDTNASVIVDQQARNRERPELTFMVASAAGTAQPDESQQVVIDKGTLDALFPATASKEQLQLVDDMWDEVTRVLSPMGRYVVVSLAQPHIVVRWSSHFMNSRQFVLRVHEVPVSASGFAMPVFVLVATKLRAAMPVQMPLEVYRSLDGKAERLTDPTDLVAAVQAEQELARFVHLCAKKLDDEVQISLGEGGEEGAARYRVHIVDDQECAQPKTYAVFIVPIGRDGDWIFATEKGRRSLRAQCQRDRLAIAVLAREHKYASLDSIKDELAGFVLKLNPRKENAQVDFLSVGAVDVKKSVASGESAMNGRWTVEDVEIRERPYRRLVFLSSQNLVQSEAALKASKKGKQVVDLDELACDHHEMSLLSLALLPNSPLLSPDHSPVRIAVLGLGGGALAAYVLRHLPKAEITAVELDPEVVKVARDWFAFPGSDPRMTVKVQDALVFLEETSKAEESRKFDAILCDVAGAMHDSGLSCPPAAFLTQKALREMRGSLKERGVLALNLVTRDDDIAKKAKISIAEHFATLSVCSSEEDVNEMILATKSDLPAEFDVKKFSKQLDKKRKWLANIADNLANLQPGMPGQ